MKPIICFVAIGAGQGPTNSARKQLTLAEVLAAELTSRARTVSEAFDDFQRWFELKRPGGNDGAETLRCAIWP